MGGSGAVFVAAVRVLSSRPLAKLWADGGGCLLQGPWGGNSDCIILHGTLDWVLKSLPSPASS